MIHHIKQPAQIPSANLEDWGPVKEPFGEVIARLRGKAGTREGEPDCGIWECSPGRWRRQVKEAEFTHILAGRCTFTADDGQRIEIAAGDTLYFPAMSMGIWDIQETVRKVYILLK
ncbi:cupin domain-containing protein [Dongia sp.]|uniref:cupin domain-containing protein n=1 Tax=Dongia sp. TaxID=1977262 RepID=UPI003751B44A